MSKVFFSDINSSLDFKEPIAGITFNSVYLSNAKSNAAQEDFVHLEQISL